jgi:membrane protease subunit HflC
MKKSIGFAIFLVVVFVLLSSSFYIVNEDEVALVKTFGKVVSVVTNPGDKQMVEENYVGTEWANVKVSDTKGLKFKIPIAQTVEKYTSKYLTYKSLKETVNTVDGRRVDVMMYAQYRVVDPALFNAVVASKSRANTRMDEEVYPTVINSINKLEFNEFFDQETLENLLDEKQSSLNNQMVADFGMYVTDIGISRKTFPVDNISTIEEKMTKEIEKESAQSIAQGDSIYNQKVAIVDAQKAQVIANAVEEAAIVKAEADAEAIRTYQESLAVDLDFYRFIQRMDIYKNISGQTIFLDKDNAIYSYINDLKDPDDREADSVSE